jgi:Uma2 family endonuclease
MHASFHLEVQALPRILIWDQPVSDDQLEALCAANQGFRFERTKEGEIRVNPPAELSTSDGNAEIIHQLRLWWKSHRKGKVADSNAGFYLKDGSMLSPRCRLPHTSNAGKCSSGRKGPSPALP